MLERTLARRSGWVLLVAALASCVEPGAGPPSPEPRPVVPADASVTCGLEPAAGCPCEGDRMVECHEEPVVRDGGRLYCRVGRRLCRGGVWSACEGVIEVPAPEEGRHADSVAAALVVGPVQCSACEPRCFTHTDQPGPGDLPGRSRDVVYDPARGGVVLEGTPVVCMSAACTRTSSVGAGTGTPWMLTPDNSEGVIVDPVDGALTLGAMGSNAYGVWIASMDDGTVSRLDPTTGREIARYPSARPDAFNRARPWNEACNWSDRGNCPSRTAVDQNFDAYVANRAFGNQGTVTKYAGRLSECRDRNGDGIIQTSRDLNGNGRIDMGTAEFVGPGDECLLWTVPVDVNNAVPRALTIGLAPGGFAVGDVWVGLFNTQRACRLNPTTGATIACVSISPITPYGAVTDPQGRIWFNGAWGVRIGHVHERTMRFQLASAPPSSSFFYGIGGWSSPDLRQFYVYTADINNYAVLRYDPATDTWLQRSTSSLGLGYQRVRGIAADETSVWVSNYSWDPAIYQMTLDLRLMNRYPAPFGSHAGIGVTFDNAIWLVSSGSRAARLAPDRGSWITTPPIFVSAYTYSDFIGFGLNVFANPRGRHSFVIDSGPDCYRYRWSRLEWRADVPPGTSVELWVRSADTVAGLATRSWIGPFRVSPADLTVAPGPVPPGRYLEVEVRLETTDRRITPRVYSVSATGLCDGWMYRPTGSYVQVYDSRDRCAGNERPAWGNLAFNVRTPPGTRIDFELRSADTPAGLASATPVVISTPPSTSPVDIEARLMAAGQPVGMSVMSVTAVLRASPDTMSTPTLYDFSVDYTCVPAE
jgi:streptogramin lyase